MFKQLKADWPFLKPLLGSIYVVVAVVIITLFTIGMVIPALVNADTFSMMAGIFVTIVIISIDIVVIRAWLESFTTPTIKGN